MPYDWQPRLNLATSPREVVQVAREYLAAWSSEDIARLPSRCRPVELECADDISAFALEVVRYDRSEDPQAAVLVHRLATFLSAATLRLSQVCLRHEASRIDTRQSA